MPPKRTIEPVATTDCSRLEKSAVVQFPGNRHRLMFAGLVIVLIPTLFVYMLLQRQLTRGITVGALKG